MARGGRRFSVQMDHGDLDKALDDLPDRIRQAARDAVVESAEAVRDDTSANVRHDTGELSENVEARYVDDSMTAEVGWFADEHYYAEFAEEGTERFAGAPSLEPAAEAERPRLPDRIRDHVGRAVG